MGLLDHANELLAKDATEKEAEATTATANDSPLPPNATATATPKPASEPTPTAAKGKSLLAQVQNFFVQANAQSVIIADTIMLACGFSPAEIKQIGKQGLHQIPNLIAQKIKRHELTEEIFLQKLFALPQADLDQLPISFYGSIVQSETFQKFEKPTQDLIFARIFATLGITDLASLAKLDAERVAYNHQSYRAIFQAFFALNKKDAAQEQEANQTLDQVIDSKLQEMLDKAPELTNDATLRQGMDFTKAFDGDLNLASDTALNLFTDTRFGEATQAWDALQQASAVGNAKIVLAQYKLGAYAAAAQAKGLINAKTAERYSVVDPAENDKPVNKFVNASKHAIANFTKPQNLAKLGFRQVATKALTHFTEGAIPGIGAAVGLAMKLGECGYQIFKKKQPPLEVFQAAVPDLARGAITVGVSFTPLAPLAGPIATVASIAVKGVQAAHAEGIKMGPDFLKRVASEFKKKGNLLNLGASALGAGVGFGAKELLHKFAAARAVTADITAELDEANLMDETNLTDTIAPDYTQEYLATHPGAHLDANGWVQNADGSYPRNADGQLFGSTDRVFRNLTADETLDQSGNIRPNFTQTQTATTAQAEPTVQDLQDQIAADLAETRAEIATAQATKAELETAMAQADHAEKLATPASEKVTLTKNGKTYVVPVAEAEAYQGQGYLIAEAEAAKVAEYHQGMTTPQTTTQQAKIETAISQADAVLDAQTETTVQTEASVETAETVPLPNRAWAGDLPVRSQSELAEIQAIQEKANLARNFNALSEAQQRHLIDLRAKAIVAQEQGDTTAYGNLKNEFDQTLNRYQAVNAEKGRISQLANQKGTQEWKIRETLAAEIRQCTDEETRKTLIQDFKETYGVDMGDKNGVRQYVHQSGDLKMEVPEVPKRNFAELGYTQQKDGTWLRQDGLTTTVIKDANHDGIPDAGDTYKKVTEFGKPGSQMYSKQESQGKLLDPEPETINPHRNAATELETAIARERAKLAEQNFTK